MAAAGLSASLAFAQEIFRDAFERGDPCAWDVTLGFSGSGFFHLDLDTDQFGDDGTTIPSPGCVPPPGYVLEGGDCDDSDPAVNPDAEEVCANGIDDNCDSLTDEEDPGCPVYPAVFVTSLVFEGNFGGLSAADDVCASLALGAGLPGVFVAFVSDSAHDAAARVTSDGPWYLVGTFPLGKVADSKADLLDGTIDTSINVDEQGLVVSGAGASGVWTGSNSPGTYSAAACNDWSTNAPNETGTSGSFNVSDQGWADANAGNCSHEFRFYCFEVDP